MKRVLRVIGKAATFYSFDFDNLSKEEKIIISAISVLSFTIVLTLWLWG